MPETLQYLIIGIAILCIFIIHILINRSKALKKLAQKLSDGWGRIPDEKYRSEEFEAISNYYENLMSAGHDGPCIDRITWNDLDMDNVYKRLNSTVTSIGEEYLFKLLRTPEFDRAKLEERERVMAFFAKNPEERLRLQLALAKLGKNRFASIADYFIGDKAEKSHEGKKYLLLCVAFVLSPLLFAVNLSLGLFAVVGMFIVNVTVHYRVKQILSSYLDSLSYIVNMTRCSRMLAELDIPEIGKYTETLRTASAKIRSLSMNSFYVMFFRSEDPLLEYIKVVFLGELIAFESLMEKIRKYKNELHTLYETIGLLDSLLSIASYRESLDFYTFPGFEEGREKGRPILSFTDIYHPMIRKPVTNSLTLSGSALVTGSNASGKSTFLKTVAINAIFAQTINTCLAKTYTTNSFLIYSSMALKDDLFSNESYYIAEIKSLKRIFDALNEDMPCLCLIDEVLRGTNTIERIAASSEVLYRLSKSNCICIAATHDLELTYILGRHFANYHFQESFQENEIVFDYKLYSGKSTTRNAIKLLKFTGYDEGIADAAEQRALNFVRDGKWTELAGDEGDVSSH